MGFPRTLQEFEAAFSDEGGRLEDAPARPLAEEMPRGSLAIRASIFPRYPMNT